MKTRNLLYLILLMVMMFISIPKISNAAPPDEEDCKSVYIICDDGSISGIAIVCNDHDYMVWKELLCDSEPIQPPGIVN